MTASLKDAALRRRTNIELVQNVLLVWLDDNNKDCRNTVTQLRRAVNSIYKYTNSEECIELLETMDNAKACMIMSDSLGSHVVTRVHNMSQVDSIFIFGDIKQYDEQWTKEWSKIRCVFTEIAPICEALKKTAQQCEQDAISISFMATSGDASNQLTPTFMYTQILKEILLTIEFEQQHIAEFIQYCRDVLVQNEDELKNVNRFEQNYRDETPIWWYTYDCFLSPMLNRALRITSADVIIKMGFFIGDLHRHIEQLHQEQFASPSCSTRFTVYRGQGMSKTDFEQMSKIKGGLMSFNNFLSTSKKCNVSLAFAYGALSNPEMVGVLFVMTIDPSKSTIPFASITNVSYFKEKEDKVLFSMHTVFRIGEITLMDGNSRLFQVELTLTSDNDNDLRVLTDHIRKETYASEQGWYQLSSVLLKMGQFGKAEQVYETLLRQTTDEDKKAPIYGQLGWTKYNQGEYTEALKFYEKALEIYKRTRSTTDLDLARCYNDIGVVYDNMGNYWKALSSYEKALEIRLQSLRSNHPDLAGSYNNIGLVYTSMGEYPKALSSHEKALEISKQSLPSNHPSLGESYNNIGNVYGSMGDYPKALSSFEKALEIKQQSLLPNHPSLGTSYNNIGLVYASMGDYSKAILYYEKDLEISKQSLPSNHPNLAGTYDNLGLTYERMSNYSKACWYYERAVDIGQRSLPPNHPNLQKWRKNFERINKKP
jgi:tetratricopeptide (TPR) repeat protein